MIAPLAGLLANLVPGLGRLARRWWCGQQRSRLRVLDPSVVWVRDGDKVPWAYWGAEHGFFELEWADHLPYLRAVVRQA